MNCQTFQTEIPELALDPLAQSSDATGLRAHLAACPACRQEFASFQSTFALLDTWKAPEPSAYFDQKLAVRLSEEQALPAAGWFERLRSHLLFNTGRQFRPVLIGSMALALLLGGGTFAGISNPPKHTGPQVSAAVDDLQILDRNDQALQQMDQLLQEDQSFEENSSQPPRT